MRGSRRLWDCRLVGLAFTQSANTCLNGNGKDLLTFFMPQQALTFLPELHSQRSLRPTFEDGLVDDVGILLKLFDRGEFRRCYLIEAFEELRQTVAMILIEQGTHRNLVETIDHSIE